MIPIDRTAEHRTDLPLTVDGRARAAFGVVAFAVLTAVGAQVAVPITQVPLTLQLLFVLLAGVVLGPRLGAASMALYLAAGAAGAPVFAAGGAGLPWLLGPTGGYLLAMPAAAFVAGLLAGAERDAAGGVGVSGAARTLRRAAGLVLAVALIYVGGVSQLVLLGGLDVTAAVAAGVVPFLLGDALKVGIVLAGTSLIDLTSLGRR